MEERTIYEQIGLRTNGNVYVGVVGPVRTGKSTFIKRVMEELVIPNIDNVYRKERARDELPQSGFGGNSSTARGADYRWRRVAATACRLSLPFRLFPWHDGALNAYRAFNFAAAPWKFARKLARPPDCVRNARQKIGDFRP